jgi:hypothetical protein
VYSGGEERDLLTGQFLHANASSKEEWTPFVTIKTSGYEQWIGAEAETFTRGSSVVWDTTGELSKALQDLLASLK